MTVKQYISTGCIIGSAWLLVRFINEWQQTSFEKATVLAGGNQREHFSPETVGVEGTTENILRKRVASIALSFKKGTLSMDAALLQLSNVATATGGIIQNPSTDLPDSVIAARAAVVLIKALESVPEATRWVRGNLGETGLKQLLPYFFLEAFHTTTDDLSELILVLKAGDSTGLADGMLLVVSKGLATPDDLLARCKTENSGDSPAESLDAMWSAWAAIHPEDAYLRWIQDGAKVHYLDQLALPYLSGLIWERPKEALNKISDLGASNPAVADKVLLLNLKTFAHLGLLSEAFNAISDQGQVAAFSSVLSDIVYYNPQEGLDWSKELMSVPGLEFGPAYVYERWIASNPLEASYALLNEPQSNLKDQVSAILAKKIALSDSDSAMLWANSIRDRGLRDDTLEWIAEDIKSSQTPVDQN